MLVRKWSRSKQSAALFTVTAWGLGDPLDYVASTMVGNRKGPDIATCCISSVGPYNVLMVRADPPLSL
jgi:hypothetical protein